MEIDRRTLIAGGVALGGLVVALRLWGGRGPQLQPTQDGEMLAGGYLRVAPDGRVTLAVPQAETGQGIWTGLAQIAADELGADWAMMAVEPAPVGGDYANPFSASLPGGAQRLTAGATSIRAFEEPVLVAAAQARARLIEAAADQWGIDPSDCDTRDGAVVAGNRRLEFGALASAAAELGGPSSPARRSIGSGPFAGKDLGRLDLAAKATGSWRFAADVRLPDMHFASARVAPPGGRIAGFDRGGAAAPGIRLVVRDAWIAAIGPTGWAADRALDAARVRFTGSSRAATPDISAALDAALASGEARTVAESGDYDAVTAERLPLAATYRAEPASPIALEPAAAAARWRNGRLELWASGRAPALAIAGAARGAGIGPGDILFYPTGAGEPEGAGMAPLAAEIASAIARETGLAVSLTLPAATSQHQAPLRPPMLAKVAALPNPAGGIDSWHIRMAGAAGLAGLVASALDERGPAFAPSSLVPPYAISALKAEAVAATLPPLRLGYMRGGEEALAAFATESFIDELARARGVEPLAFRIGLLSGSPRLAKALASAARLGGWDGGGKGSSLGLACASAFGSHIGLLAEASLGSDQRVKVSRLVAAVDCGRAINPRLVRQQVEGALMSALTTATGPVTEIVAGVARARPLGALALSRLGAAPTIDVAVIPSTEAPGGVSGLGAIVLAPALANAIHAATGMRLRRLPLDPMTPA